MIIKVWDLFWPRNTPHAIFLLLLEPNQFGMITIWYFQDGWGSWQRSKFDPEKLKVIAPFNLPEADCTIIVSWRSSCAVLITEPPFCTYSFKNHWIACIVGYYIFLKFCCCIFGVFIVGSGDSFLIAPAGKFNLAPKSNQSVFISGIKIRIALPAYACSNTTSVGSSSWFSSSNCGSTHLEITN